jgi:glycosyltransferase involved in cell wall biosynthesis
VLICVDYFHPSVGGSERLAEHVGVHLRALGWQVEVATRALPQRTRREHRGMRIHEIRRPAEEILRLVTRGRFDAVLALSDPRAWPVPIVCALPDGGARRVVVPCINLENLAHLLADEGRLQRHLELVHRADAHVHSSLSGLDARLAEQLRVASTYVPNAADRLEQGGDAPPPGEGPLALVVGNLWPEKNHVGLLSALGGRAGDWRLALIGGPAPGAEALAARVRALAARDARVHLAGPRSPADVAAAMRAADVLLLPSLAEATPLVLVEAMAHGLPWIATPECGAAHDHAGGLILPVRDMGDGLDFLLADPGARAALGAAGREHWEMSYRWETVAARYDLLLSGAAALPPLAPPGGAIAATDAVRAAQLDALVAPRPAPATLQAAVR